MGRFGMGRSEDRNYNSLEKTVSMGRSEESPNRKYLSFEEKRQAMYEAAMKWDEENGSRSVVKSLHFYNDDVPRFLVELKRFQEESRKKVILVR